MQDSKSVALLVASRKDLVRSGLTGKAGFAVYSMSVVEEILLFPAIDPSTYRVDILAQYLAVSLNNLCRGSG